jgi:hypothetical protein
VTDINEMLNDLIVRLAVTERLLFDVTGSLIAESPEPEVTFTNVLAQLRSHFDPSGADSPGALEFHKRATEQVARVERQLKAAAFPVSEH